MKQDIPRNRTQQFWCAHFNGKLKLTIEVSAKIDT